MSATTVAFSAPETHMPILAAQSITGHPHPRMFTSPSGVVYELVYVTPDLADEWLDDNTNNRALRSQVVEKLGRDMKAGRFLENGDAVRFAASGLLLDGQHRLHGLITSQTSAWLLVVSNLPERARDTVDDGTKRTMGDRLAFHGESDAKTLAAVVRRAYLWNNGMPAPQARLQPSALELFEFLSANPDLRDAADMAARYRKAKLLSASTIGLCWWLFNRIDAGQCAEFFDRLNDGTMLPKNHPILTLRNRLTDLAAQSTRLPSHYPAAMTVKAWNYFRAGKDLITVRYAEHENFPTPK
jgi:hypothetical protein